MDRMRLEFGYTVRNKEAARMRRLGNVRMRLRRSFGVVGGGVAVVEAEGSGEGPSSWRFAIGVKRSVSRIDQRAKSVGACFMAAIMRSDSSCRDLASCSSLE